MEKIIFKNSLNQKLVGNLENFGRGYIVVHCHGYGSNKNSETALLLQRELAKNKISSFAFDFSDTGESECKREDLTVSAGIDDLISAIKYLKSLGFQNFGLSGSSFGGSVVFNYTLKDKNIKAIALKAPVSDWSSIFASPLRLKKFVKDASKYTIYSKASQIQCPVLIFHGDQDETVPVEQSKKTCGLIKNCRLKIIKGADHQLADHDSRIKLINDFVGFFEEHKP